MSELVTPRHTALIVIDVQNDFCVKGGIFDKHGMNVSACQKIIKNLKSTIDAARRARILLVYTQNTTLPKRMSDSPAWIHLVMKLWNVTDPDLVPEVTLEGSWGQDFVEDVRPLQDEIVVKKYRNSAFVGTSLDFILRNANIKTLVITGVLTHACVESTVRDG